MDTCKTCEEPNVFNIKSVTNVVYSSMCIRFLMIQGLREL